MKEYIITVDETKRDIMGGMRVVDKEELIRCGDCKYWNPWNCQKEGGVRSPDWFCADGKRRG